MIIVVLLLGTWGMILLMTAIHTVHLTNIRSQRQTPEWSVEPVVWYEGVSCLTLDIGTPSKSKSHVLKDSFCIS